MPTFRYKVLSNQNTLSEGAIVATTRREALQRLIASGQHPLDCQEQTDKAQARFEFRFHRKVIRLATFTRQLATLSASGAPIIKGLGVIADQTRDPRAKQVLSDIAESVQSGNTLADALNQHPAVFPKLMVSMVRVGEMGGTLDEQLLQLSELYEKEETLKGEVQAALAYPFLVFLLGLLSTFILVAFFIPRIEGMFDASGEALPLPTRILLAISHFITGHPWLLLIGALVVFFGVHAAFRRPEVRLMVDKAKLKTPWFGTLVLNLEVARFTRLLGTLTKAGISIVEALNIVAPVVQNRAMAETVRGMIGRITGGERLAELMKASNLFPPLTVQMVSTGEETGHLDQMLLRLAEAYDRETGASTKVVMSLLAPVLILAVAVVVGFILIAMLLPIFQLSSVMR